MCACGGPNTHTAWKPWSKHRSWERSVQAGQGGASVRNSVTAATALCPRAPGPVAAPCRRRVFPAGQTLAVLGTHCFPYRSQGLKKNWEEVHKEFQSFSVFIDSIPKKVRKQKLEEQMKQLEHDIGVIEKHKIIYIANKQ